MPVKECKGGQTSSFALRKVRTILNELLDLIGLFLDKKIRTSERYGITITCYSTYCLLGI
jgi:hypothetical protein